ncbi:MAG TPA: glucoamylase family protein [Kofleriaceae bacterium]|jgi:cellobiose phosphorylase
MAKPRRDDSSGEIAVPLSDRRSGRVALPPLRAELFSASQLEQHAKMLAGSHVVSASRGEDGLLERLADNKRELAVAYALIADAVARGRQITPAAEWFIDNYHLLEEQIRIARRHLPRGYSRLLPRLEGDQRVPRVYELALELISHSEGRVDLPLLRAFVLAYQTVQPLKLGELWAIPIMLRLALLENLRRVIAGVTSGRREREQAAEWADALLEGAAGDPSRTVIVLAKLVEANPPMTTPFIAELASRLQGQGSVATLPMSWLEQQLQERGQSVEHAFQAASQSQAADQVAVGNSITSLRTLDAIDWRDFVEELSVVEAALRHDPAEVYSTMDFATRDRYRHCVEHLARRARLAEVAVAERAVSLASRQATPRTKHVGYFLIDRGRRALELALHERPHNRALARRAGRGARLAAYLAIIGGGTAVLTGAIAPLVGHHPALIAAWTVAVALCASQIAVGVVHWAATLLVHPSTLPRLDFTRGVPDAHRTLVAVPVLLTTASEIDVLVERLEVRFLANRDRNVGFSLVGDFRDATSEHDAGDDELVLHAVHAIDALNAKYPNAEQGGGFFLFHRPRRWNPRERAWMGWERKRGKLEELNNFLRGDRSGFTTVAGPLERLDKIAYVIVLDSDTELPRDAARELAGTLGHPLNRPVFDEARGRVTEGYAILQPRVGVTLDSVGQSRFSKLFAGEPGIDPYTRAVSDVYQDLFGEGSFIGKGIYDVDAIRRALGGKLPDNRVLSHDLLEGAYGRAGLVSDVIVFEDYPATYAVDATRRSRWIRGDWQIARWLLRRVPGREPGARLANLVSALSQWKIFDNLRRSVVPIALAALLALGVWLPDAAGIALALVAITFALPSLLAALVDAARPAPELGPGLRTRSVVHQLARSLSREALGLACLPVDAWLSIRAIGRAVVRLWITKRKLLEWKTAADASRTARTGFAGTYAGMWTAPALAAAIAAGLATDHVAARWLAVPLIALWTVAPAAAWWLGKPVVAPVPHLGSDERAFLRGVARRTWRFFDTYVAAEDNFLPPDNFQEDPPVGVAHRTSPTNIGLALLASLAAWDLGYLDTGGVIERTRRTFATLDKLGRYRGHFYNWYDTKSLEPLRPMYVSTVDSGNLAGHLMTLAAGLEDLANQPIVRRERLAGLADSLALYGVAVPAALRGQPRTLAAFRDAMAAARAAATGAPAVVAECDAALADLDAVSPQAGTDHIPTLAEVARGDGPGAEHAAARIDELRALALHANELGDYDYSLLYDPARHQMAIGFNVADHRLDASYYDLLASEARLASYVAIAQNKLPQEHWFHLGRRLTTTTAKPALLSWSGSMFEYLMPLLVMPTYRGTLLDATYRAAVARQIEYGRDHHVPWGVSESGYNKTDAQLNYQYRAFGVPGLGFKRGLGSDLVIAPYASVLALMVAPELACENLERLAADGRLGPDGFYEAIDYTQSRLPPGATSVTVRSYMAHHQGMSLLALDDVLEGHPMQRRFLSDPALRATELLLHERVPRTASVYPHPAEVTVVRTSGGIERDLRVFATPQTPAPEVHLLSNGTYHVAITNAGGGYSRWKDLAVTRWAEDATRDAAGSFCYLRDVGAGHVWSVAHQPTLKPATSYEAIFSAGRAEFRRRDHDIDTHVEIAVSPEDDLELRRITLTNLGTTKRTLELTSYAEIVLAPAAADAAHRAFSSLFVETELLGDQQAILCTRRPRSKDEHVPWLVHFMTASVASAKPMSFETDRAAFLGRDATLVDPAAMHAATLGGGSGAVLDPIVSVRGAFELAPDQAIQLHVVTGIADSRDAVLALLDKYSTQHLADRVLELAWTQSQVVQRRLEASNADVRLWEQLAGHVIFSNPSLRAPRSVLAANRLGQAGLWAYSVSGDLPIVLVRASAPEHIDLVRQLVRAHAYWRLKGLAVDLVIWNEDPSGYRQNLQEQITEAIAAVGDSALVDQKGGIYVRRTDQMPEADSVLFQTVARVILNGSAATLAEQLDRRPRAPEPQPPAFERESRKSTTSVAMPAMSRPDLVGWNGYGGFTADGREYVIVTHKQSRTPAPWVNVLANRYFGSVVSESGSAYTWCENANAYRLTPWSNDFVADPSGECLYIRDEDDGTLWSPTPLPAPGNQPYTTRHGFGYSVFETVESGIASELTTFVAMDAPAKLFKLKLRNRSGRTRKLAVTIYVELVLGNLRAAMAPHIVTEIDVRTGALFARNPYAAEFASRVAFLECSEDQRAVSGDRLEVIGRNGTYARPAALARTRLSNRVGAALDPCLAMQVTVEIPDNQEREIVFVLGSGRDVSDARSIVARTRSTGAAQTSLAAVWQYWNSTLGAVNVQTPDAGFNFLANGWLVYQVLAARLWGRSGFYQSGGAYGFRDQLQDTAALVHAEPALAREQLVRAAAHQFPQGDVQHWWHPPLGRGVRTRISDDYLWLPYAAIRYVDAVGDTGVLDEKIEFIDGRPVGPTEDSYYDLPVRSNETASLYDHCVRAIEHGLRMGAHGLPLMGTGDWNDGMNLVGEQGRGESVWLAFFLYDVLVRFESLARRRGDSAFADRCVAQAAELRGAIASSGWDGEWYRRAYFDDGTPLGSHDSPECQIDSLPQSWAVFSGAGEVERATQALAAVDARLVDRELGVVKLFDPPFDRSALEPGYIKGYLPGVRENGGQYTHAAVWVAMAFAASGDAARAWELFELLSPLHHGGDPAAIARYRVEPYVLAADVYTNPQHAGRGGWTWYTGSAGWMYRLAVESLLGLRLEVDHLRLEPVLPAAWHELDIHYRYRETVHHIHVRYHGGDSRVVRSVVCDSVDRADHRIPLYTDHVEHWITVDVGDA